MEWPLLIPRNLSVETTFNLATIKGAKVNMKKDTVHIAEGSESSLATVDTLQPSMVAAARHDSVTDISFHSTPADIDTFIIDRIIRNRNGKSFSVIVDDLAE